MLTMLAMQQITILEALRQAGRVIDEIDARMLLQYVLSVSHSYLLAHHEQDLAPGQALSFRTLTMRRAHGEPVAYLTGKREFYSLDFAVTPAVLIPRHETELLVDLSLARIPLDLPCKVLDLGTGSGAIALTIARHRPSADIIAVDFSADALKVAGKNAEQLNVSNVRIMEADWFKGLAGEQFNLIVSNPPYVAYGDPHLDQGDLRFEPGIALAAGDEGLDCIQSIIASAPAHLAAGGALLLEHGYDQAETCRQLLGEAGFAGVFSHPDLAGVMRVSGGYLAVS
ncbi:peptide chain release factor N(5)-glutamine methyltransferase [Nitrosospira briensis]|uniref:peptide chain release factor N(5)-glutamine methyltransferase n=1 Tax=Nitrosospira briensis TaxID=35799 RepID=UPI0008ED458A|nr:peptide chain release factor N(5)-glutamine methyltransferase [Nitrosospira briensis]SFN83564.1 [protein release factor]-glutamine N5-methyltransferase [Nitrosospira briensis]